MRACTLAATPGTGVVLGQQSGWHNTPNAASAHTVHTLLQCSASAAATPANAIVQHAHVHTPCTACDTSTQEHDCACSNQMLPCTVIHMHAHCRMCSAKRRALQDQQGPAKQLLAADSTPEPVTTASTSSRMTPGPSPVHQLAP
jgi:hypothetical protein